MEREAALFFVLLGADGEETVLDFNSTPELELKAERTVQGWGYEMRLPLQSATASKLAFSMGKASLLGIGLETGRAEGGRPAARERRTGGRAGGPGRGQGLGGTSGGRNNAGFGGSGGPNRGGGRGVQRPQTLKIWTLISLIQP